MEKYWRLLNKPWSEKVMAKQILLQKEHITMDSIIKKMENDIKENNVDPISLLLLR